MYTSIIDKQDWNNIVSLYIKNLERFNLLEKRHQFTAVWNGNMCYHLSSCSPRTYLERAEALWSTPASPPIYPTPCYLSLFEPFLPNNSRLPLNLANFYNLKLCNIQDVNYVLNEGMKGLFKALIITNSKPIVTTMAEFDRKYSVSPMHKNIILVTYIYLEYRNLVIYLETDTDIYVGMYPSFLYYFI